MCQISTYIARLAHLRSCYTVIDQSGYLTIILNAWLIANIPWIFIAISPSTIYIYNFHTANKEATAPNVPLGWVEIITSIESFTVAVMTWFPGMEYLCHKWPRICSTCRNHFPILSSFITYHRVHHRVS